MSTARVQEQDGFHLGQGVMVLKKGPTFQLPGTIQDFPSAGKVTVLVPRKGLPAMAPMLEMKMIRAHSS